LLKIALRALGALALLVIVAVTYFVFFGSTMTTAEFWESEIEDFEAADAERFPEQDLVLFVGSSSFRLWSTLEEDMAPLRVLNRGFGGAHMSHVLHFADRIIAPYAARAIVLYVGDNDIGAGKTPDEVERDFRSLVAHVRLTQPDVPFYFVTIKASRLRWELWPVMTEANDRIKAIAATDPLISVIDVSAPMIERGGGGEPPSELFRFDGLHLSAEGYALWTSVIKPQLVKDLGATAPPAPAMGSERG